eukprot:SAG11_NODE_14938_length_594_cov_1.036364_2_plen_115_part_00
MLSAWFGLFAANFLFRLVRLEYESRAEAAADARKTAAAAKKTADEHAVSTIGSKTFLVGMGQGVKETQAVLAAQRASQAELDARQKHAAKLEFFHEGVHHNNYLNIRISADAKS